MRTKGFDGGEVSTLEIRVRTKGLTSWSAGDRHEDANLAINKDLCAKSCVEQEGPVLITPTSAGSPAFCAGCAPRRVCNKRRAAAATRELAGSRGRG